MKSKKKTNAKFYLAKLFKQPFLLLIYFYRYFITPAFPARCRFYPSCSEYAAIALKRFGILRGSFLTLKRLFRCHPFGGSGIDEVPCNH